MQKNLQDIQNTIDRSKKVRFEQDSDLEDVAGDSQEEDSSEEEEESGSEGSDGSEEEEGDGSSEEESE